MAILALLNTPENNAHAYTLGGLKKLAQLPALYTEVVVTQRFVEGGRFGGRSSSTRGWRVQTRVVAQSEVNAQRLRAKGEAALLDRRVTVDGLVSTQIKRAISDDPIAPDDGWYSGLSEWHYAH